MKVCGKCRGIKEIAEMGGIKLKCTTCDGKGIVKTDEPKKAEVSLCENKAIDDLDSSDLEKKKMGRQKKFVENTEEEKEIVL